MRIYFLVVFLTLLFIATPALSQEKSLRVIADFGVELADARMSDLSYIRADWYDVNGYGASYSYGTRSSMNRNVAALKFERRNSKDMIGFISGIRYSRVNSFIEKAGSPEYFFVKLRENGLTTEYAKVAELDQSLDYIGIPLEVRVFTVKPRSVRLYFLAGGDANFRLHTINRIRFIDPEMNENTDDISAMVGNPSDFYASFYARAGLTFGKSERFSFAITFPFVVTNAASSIVNGGFGGGLGIQIQQKL